MLVVLASAGNTTERSQSLTFSTQVHLQLTETRQSRPTAVAFCKPLAPLHDAWRRPSGYTIPSGSAGSFLWNGQCRGAFDNSAFNLSNTSPCAHFYLPIACPHTHTSFV